MIVKYNKEYYKQLITDNDLIMMKNENKTKRTVTVTIP